MERRNHLKLLLVVVFPIWVSLLALVGYYLGRYNLWPQVQQLLGIF